MMKNKIEFKNFSFQYAVSDSPALRAIDLTIASGEFVVFCGVGGSGKTTLLRQIKPELRPHGKMTGEMNLRFDGTNEREAIPVAMVMQNPKTQIVMHTVWHELAFGLENMGLPYSEIERRIAEVANFFGIESWIYQKTDALSGGEKQILNLAANIILQPEILILDEPTSQLDPIARREFLSLLHYLHSETGTTILLSEHQLEDLLEYADQVVFLEAGEVAFKGAPRDFAGFLLQSDNPFAEALPLAACMAKAVQLPRTFSENSDILSGNLDDDVADLSVLDGVSDLALPDLSSSDLFLPDRSLPDRSVAGLSASELLADDLSGVSNNRHKILPPLSIQEGRAFLRGEFSGFSLAGSLEADPETPAVRAEKTEMICMEQVWFRYQPEQKLILREADLSIREHEILAIMGGNGSGKSTLLYLLCKALTPLKGKVKIASGRRVAMLGQNPESVFSAETVSDVLTEYQAGFSIKDTEIQELIDLFELGGLLDRHPFDISGGEKQRLALAKVLLTKPDILLLDEPAKSLDSIMKKKLQEILLSLKEEITIVLVTHDLEFASMTADRIAMLFNQKVIAEASMREFFKKNSYYTTAAYRLSRDLIPEQIRATDLLKFLESTRSSRQMRVDRNFDTEVDS